MNKIEEDLPDQVRKILAEVKDVAEEDPTSGNYVLVGQNGYLEKGPDLDRSSFVGSGLIERNKVSEVFQSIEYPGNILHDVGRPEYWKSGKGEYRYDVETCFKRHNFEVEAFVIEREDPATFLTFMPRQDFIIFYSLFDRIEWPNRTWDDHVRRTNDVIKFERNEMLSKIRILKNYILDYLFVRKKALLIGYYYSIMTTVQDEVPIDYRKEVRIEGDRGKAKILPMNLEFPIQETCFSTP